ncbi:MAG: efflux RND transporter periplasmic adaptor subunit [Sulfuriflexus sp.]|nr:efflux RND transporter periplasmic adaptor subunit [Sulfuriflexus sp.]
MSDIKSNPLIKKIILLGAVLGLSVLIIGILLKTAPENNPAPQALVAVKVSSVIIRATTIHPEVSVTGRLQPANRALLRFETSGQLEQRLVEPGQLIEAGTVLLRLSDADARDSLIEATARLDMEKAAVARDRRLLEIAAKDVVLQQQEVKRLKRLGSESLVSVSRRDQATQKLLQLQANEAQLRYSVDTAPARLKSVGAALARATRNLTRTGLLAPFSGTVNVVNIEVGDYVTPSAVAIELVDLENIDLYIEVDGTTAAALSLQQKVSLQVNGKTQTGVLIAIRSDPDPTTFTHAVRIRLDNKGLLPGTLGSVQLPLQVQASALVVPVSSLLQEDGRSYVFVIKGTQLERREVKMGTRDKDRIVIESGLQDGVKIVARDIAALTDGQKVEFFK